MPARVNFYDIKIGPAISKRECKFAQNGFSVTLYNRRDPSLERAKALIATNLDTLAADNRLKESQADILARLDYSTSFEVFRQADFVVENIAEDLEVKQTFFRNICQLVPNDIALTTNTPASGSATSLWLLRCFYFFHI